MFKPTKILDVELSHSLEDIVGLDNYAAVQLTVRFHGRPIGWVTLPITKGRCSVADFMREILEKHTYAIVRHLLRDALVRTDRPGRLSVEELLTARPQLNTRGPFPLVTVAVCTRNRVADLRHCLDSLKQLDYPNLELLVVENAATCNGTEQLIRTSYPGVRYVSEPRPGLNWARNRAIQEARGDIIAFTDDDVVVDPGWVKALATVFVENPEVMAVTGLVIPYELDTEAQALFEAEGGFGRGLKRQWYRVEKKDSSQVATLHGGSGKFGTGANMAYRRRVFDQIGHFDPALDTGTPTGGGGDLEMFFRVVKEGHTLVREPNAVTRHRHRRSYTELHRQLFTWGSGFYSYLLRSGLAYPEERLALFRFGMRWFYYRNIRWGLLVSLLHPSSLKRGLKRAELWGALAAPFLYLQSRRGVSRIVQAFGPLAQQSAPESTVPSSTVLEEQKETAVRTVDLRQPLSPLIDVAGYLKVRLYVIWGDRLLGCVNIPTLGQPISRTRLCDAIVDHLGLRLLEPDQILSPDSLRREAYAAVAQHFLPRERGTKMVGCASLPAEVSVSVVVATYDRPDDLRNCLSSLSRLESPRRLEIVVVDNHPNSGLTPPVVSEFPQVVLVKEPRKGLAYARNAGIVASQGEIVVTTDDDVIVPSDWVEKLILSFSRGDVAIVTGNVLPFELETKAQQLFEAYGGLGRRFERREVTGAWFESSLRHPVATWTLGATANAAFRATIFSHPQIRLMDEALGPGTPTGVGEDTYLFYKTLKAGYTLIYEPSAYVWHRHRRDTRALRHQLYNYSKGHVAYHLTTLFRDCDLRALTQLIVNLPRWHFKRINDWVLRKSQFPLSLVLIEIAGNLVGPWALWRSHCRVRREGRSKPYVPVALRVTVTQKPFQDALPANLQDPLHRSSFTAR